MLAEARQLYPTEPIRQAMYTDQHTFLCSLLDRNDRMTMGASIECRPPFLDYRLVEGTAALPSTTVIGTVGGKRLLRQAVGNRLPDGVLRYRKWGFAVPWTRYMQHEPEFRDLIASLDTATPIAEGPFDRSAIRRLATDFLGGDTRYEGQILRLVKVAIWHQACLGRIRRAGAVPRTEADALAATAA
jgi:asparagine synthase (glutamine-hydrolysing)